MASSRRSRPPSSGPRRAGNRERLAFEAARLAASEGLDDLDLALRKAARRLGGIAPADWPERAEVERQLRDYQRLFRPQAQAEALRRRLQTAEAAMTALATFEPRLVGAVLAGVADEHSPVRLQLFSDEPEAVARALLDRGIPAEGGEQVIEPAPGQRRALPAWRFLAGGIVVELVVLPTVMQRQAPRAPGQDGMPAHAGLARVRALLAEAERAHATDPG